ncbi:bifunctional aspartate kinase/homoserine dehydrogenase I [Namhaeicola litoreus]|uniref:Bifunctional aspartate kinase/homoserine dehydrogenase I n=1 Tax=Namhaeicola litoreus TaxID=1052145 RepID=A0ABW3Y2R8_9FLAO
MIVAKFGGTSVGSAKNIQKVVEIISHKNEKCIVVVSALGGVTNLLIKASELAVKGDQEYVNVLKDIQTKHKDTIDTLFDEEDQENSAAYVMAQMHKLKDTLKGVYLLNDLSEKSLAKIVSVGEILSSYIISEAFRVNGMNCELFDSRLLIKTDSHYSKAGVHYQKTYKNIKDAVKNSDKKVMIMPGFIASDEKNNATTLGRGGSDFTAAIAANAIDAELLEIWTDVSGMFTANPQIVKQAKPIEQITYQEAMELSHFGAKVIYPPTIQPAMDKKIPILIKNTMAPNDRGTLIAEKTPAGKNMVKGISHIEQISLLTLQGNGMVGVPGIAKRLFGALSQQNINVKFITQASSEHSISFAIDDEDAENAKIAVDNAFEYEIFQRKINPVTVESDLAIIALVGDNMKSHQGISGKMFSSLGNNNVNIVAIAQGSTEKNISAVIAKKDAKKALNSLHTTFFENQLKQINLFIVGVGNVGSKLLEQIKQQQSHLLEKLHLEMKVVGLANSKKMIFDEDGIDLDNWKEELHKSKITSNLDEFYNQVINLNLRNSVFVDNTANDVVPSFYEKYLKKSMAVVACNKVASSSDYANYNLLKELSKEYNAPYLFETNVGAGLPIIDNLKNMINSGDEIQEIKAVLSGSLNFIFNNFDAKNSFYDVVKKAGEEGYTEPDPRIDLSGVDVMRKILILVRESGIQMELSDIENESFLPKNSLNAKSVEDFMESLKTEANHFNLLREGAEKNNSKLKFIASFNRGKAKVKLEQIPQEHPFYNLDGKDNIVLFYSNRYADQPLIIKGAGAGSDVTASGIFGDIIRTINK